LQLKTDFENLEIIYKASSNFDSFQPVNCENYAILGSQNCVFKKASIGYQIGFKGKQRKYNSFFKTNEQQFSSPSTCFYCMGKDHYVRNCKIRRFDVPKGLVRWMPERITNTCGPNFNRVPRPQTYLFCRYVWHPVNYCGTWIVDVPNI